MAMVVAPALTLGVAAGFVLECARPGCVDQATALIERSPLPTPVPPVPTGGVHSAGTAVATTTNSTFMVVSNWAREA
jgi:hypothetical protein